MSELHGQKIKSLYLAAAAAAAAADTTVDGIIGKMQHPIFPKLTFKAIDVGHLVLLFHEIKKKKGNACVNLFNHLSFQF